MDRLLARGIHTLQIIVAEAPRQEGSYTRKLTSPPLSFAEGGVVSRPKPCIHAAEEEEEGGEEEEEEEEAQGR